MSGFDFRPSITDFKFYKLKEGSGEDEVFSKIKLKEYKEGDPIDTFEIGIQLTLNGLDYLRNPLLPIEDSYMPFYLHIATYTHRLGMQQPQSRKLIAASQLDIIFCPLVAVDEQGNRMGMGGGYYDTTLAHSHHFGLTKPLKIGWCYDFQVVEQLACQSWDVPLDALITPSRIRWF